MDFEFFKRTLSFNCFALDGHVCIEHVVYYTEITIFLFSFLQTESKKGP